MPKRIGAGIELLADPTRRRIVALIATGRRRPAALAAEIGLSRPSMSRQLRLLEEAGIVIHWPTYGDARSRTYVIAPGMHGRIIAWLAGTEVGRRFP